MRLGYGERFSNRLSTYCLLRNSIKPMDKKIDTATANSPTSQGDTIQTGNAEWLVYNLLSLGHSACISWIAVHWLHSFIDGGGIRGYWSLLVLQKLMEFIGIEEEKDGCLHSFQPGDWPDNVYQTGLTNEEEERRKRVYDPQRQFSELLHARRYLPCHYFDYICGSSTGA